MKQLFERDRFLLAVNAAISMLCSFVLLKIAIDLIGLSGRGSLVLLMTYSTIGCNLLRFGLNQGSLSVFNQVKDDPVRTDRTLSCFIALTLWQAGLGIVLAVIAANNFLEGTLNGLGVSSATFAIYFGSYILNSALVFYASMLLPGRYLLEHTIVFNGCVFSLIYGNSLSSSASVTSFVIILAIGLCLGSIFLFIRGRVPMTLVVRFADARPLLTNGSRVVVWSNLKDLMYKLDLLILPYLLSSQQFGLYTVVQSVVQSVWRVTDPLSGIYQRELTMGSAGARVMGGLKFPLFLMLSALIFGLASVWAVGFFVSSNIEGIELSVFFFGVMTLLFVYWKFVAVEFVVLGRNRFMYVTIVTYILSYILLVPHVSHVSDALILASSVYGLSAFLAFLLPRKFRSLC